MALEASRRTPKRPARFGVRREGATRPRVGPPRRFFTGTQIEVELSCLPLRVLRVLRVSISRFRFTASSSAHLLASLRDAGSSGTHDPVVALVPRAPPANRFHASGVGLIARPPPLKAPWRSKLPGALQDVPPVLECGGKARPVLGSGRHAAFSQAHKPHWNFLASPSVSSV